MQLSFTPIGSIQGVTFTQYTNNLSIRAPIMYALLGNAALRNEYALNEAHKYGFLKITRSQIRTQSSTEIDSYLLYSVYYTYTYRT